MRETILSVLLVIVVGASLVLSGMVWFGSVGVNQYAPPVEYYQFVSEEGRSKDLSQLLTPSRLIVHLGGDRHTVFMPTYAGYDTVLAAYTEALEQLDAAGPLALEPATTEAIESLRGGQGIEAALPLALPLADWLSVWNHPAAAEQMPEADRLLETDRLLFFWGQDAAAAGPRAFMAVPGGAYLELPLAGQLDALRQEVANLARSQQMEYVALPTRLSGLTVNDGIYVRKDAVYLAAIGIKPEEPDAEALARSFFRNWAVVRKVEERDGTVIFTDGQRVLRCYPSGAIEFTQPPLPVAGTGRQAPPSALDVLQESGEFITFHRGWPTSCYPTGVVLPQDPGGDVALAYSWRYRGYPIVGVREAITMKLEGRHVTCYTRYVPYPTGVQSQPAPAVGARQHVLQRLAEQGSVRHGRLADERVTNVYLAYLCNRHDAGAESLVPVWVVEFARGIEVFLNAHTGEELW